jgi:tripartite motif-containing protein 9/67
VQSNGHDLEATVLRQCDSLIEAIERRKVELVKNIREHRIRKHQAFADQMSESTGRLHRNTGLLQFGIEALKETDPTAFLLVTRDTAARCRFHARIGARRGNTAASIESF